MSQGFDAEKRVVYLNDTVPLTAYLERADEEPVPVGDLMNVSFAIQKPDKERVTLAGSIEEDGAGTVLFADADQQGEYFVVATFTLIDGTRQSIRSDFQVDDPFPAADDTEMGSLEAAVWLKFEDLFDSEDGGPWLRDMTLNVFSPNKIHEFMNDALFEINNYNPPTELDLGYFYVIVRDVDGIPIEARENDSTNIIVLGTELAIIRHLMRSYTEQPDPKGGQITYEDRRDYLQRWGTIYQIEWQRYDMLLKLWKRRFLDLNKGKLLVSSKAGRLLPARMRTWQIGRGYY